MGRRRVPLDGRVLANRRVCHGSFAVDAAVRPSMVVVHTPIVENESRFITTQEQLPLQQFIPKPAVERFHVAILPRTGLLNVERIDTGFAKPLLNRLGDELRAVVTAVLVVKVEETMLGSKCSLFLRRASAALYTTCRVGAPG